MKYDLLWIYKYVMKFMSAYGPIDDTTQNGVGEPVFAIVYLYHMHKRSVL